MGKYNYEMNDNRYLTPPVLIENGLRLLAQLKGVSTIEKFDLDVCCSNHNVPALEYYSYPEHDGLAEDWKDYNWCNPPFDQCSKWIKKAYNESLKGRNTVMLIPARTETKYWHEYILYPETKNVEVVWLRKGYRFLNADNGEEMGIFKNALAFVIFKGIDKLEEAESL